MKCPPSQHNHGSFSFLSHSPTSPLLALDYLARALAADPATASALFHTHSPGLADLGPIWDAQVAAHHEGMTVALLRAAAAAVRAGSASGDPATANAAAQAAAAFASGGRRLRLAYYCLASGSRARVVAALNWLAAVSEAGGAGGAAPAALARGFDWSLPALAALARPPRPRSSGGGGRAAPHQPDWQAQDRGRRPAAALVLQWGAALLRNAPPPALAPLLSPGGRPLFSALLDRLGSVPCAETAAGVLEALHDALRRSDAPPAVRAGALGDAALGQLVALAEGAGGGAGGAEDGDAAAALPFNPAADAAATLFRDVATDPAYGFASAVGGGEEGGAPTLSSARRRLGRALGRLRPLDSAAHWALAAAVASRSPGDASFLYAACPLSSAEPGDAGGRWLAACALGVGVGRGAAAAALPAWLVEGATTRSTAPPPPPPPDSPAARALLSAAGLPPPLTRASLSRGVLCPDPVARHASLAAVRAAASGAGRVLAALDAAGPPCAPLAARVRAALRSALPDAQALVSAHSAAVAGLEKGGGGGAASLALVGAAAAALAALLAALPAAAVDARLDSAARLLPLGCEAWPPGVLAAALAAWEAGAGPAGEHQTPERAATSLPHLLRVAGGCTDAGVRSLAASAAAAALAAGTGERGVVAAAWVASIGVGGAAPGGALLSAVCSAAARRPLEAAAALEALPLPAQAAGPLAAAAVTRALTGAAKGAPDAGGACAAAAAGVVAAAPFSPAGLTGGLAAAAALVSAIAAEVQPVDALSCPAAACLTTLAGLGGGGLSPTAWAALGDCCCSPSPSLAGPLPWPALLPLAAAGSEVEQREPVSARLVALLAATGRTHAAWKAHGAAQAGAALVAGAQAASPAAPLLAAAAAAAAGGDGAAWEALLEHGGPLVSTFTASSASLPCPPALAAAVPALVAGGLATGGLPPASAAPILARVIQAFSAGEAGSDDAVVALAPWLPAGEVLAAAAGRLAPRKAGRAKAAPPPPPFAAAAALLRCAGGSSTAVVAQTHVDVIVRAAADAVVHGGAGGGAGAAEAEACLAAGLNPATPAGRSALASFPATASAPLLAACLGDAVALSPARAAIAASLAGSGDALADATAGALAGVLAAAPPPARREASAMALPAVVASLSRAVACPGAVPRAQDLVSAYRPALEAYLGARAGGRSSAKPTPAPAPSLSPPAEAALRAHAPTAAALAWRLAGLGGDVAGASALAARLAPPSGWPPSAAVPPPGTAGAARPATGERGRAAAALAATVPALAPAVALCVASTLAALGKASRAGPASPADAGLEEALWAELDGRLGDGLAAPATPPTARAALAPAAGALVREALRALKRGSLPDPASRVRRVRRLLAALLPPDGGGGEGMEVDGGGEAAAAAAATALARLGAEAVAAALASLPALGLTAPTTDPLPPVAAVLATPVHSVLAAGGVGGGRKESGPRQNGPCLGAEGADLLDAALALEAAYAAGGAPSRPGAEGLRSALPTLVSAYSGTLGRRDRALARVLAAAGAGGEEDGQPAGDPFLFSARLASPLAIPPSAVDPRRAALTCVHWPEGRTLDADDSDGEGGEGEGEDERLWPSPSAPHPAGADPAAVLPGAVRALRDGTAPPSLLASSGVLSLALRALASIDAGLRWAGYEVVALAASALEAGVAAASSAKAAAAVRRAASTAARHGDGAPSPPPPLPSEEDPAAAGAAAAAGPAGPQLLLLLRVLRASVPAPGARLPTLVAVFAAEAAAALGSPAAPGYGPANRALLRAPALALGDVPWLKALSCGAASRDARADVARVLALLGAGMRAPADGLVFRRRFIGELLMGGVGGGGRWSGGQQQEVEGGRDAGGVSAALAAIPAAAPALAADLAGRAGYAEWLAGAIVCSGGADVGCLAALAALAAQAAATPPSPAGAALVGAAAAVVGALAGASPPPSPACWVTALRLVADAHWACGGVGGASAPPALDGRGVRAALGTTSPASTPPSPAVVASLLAAVAALPLPTLPAAAEGVDSATTGAWLALADLAGPAAGAGAATQPRPAWVEGGEPSRPAFAPAAAMAFLAWLARAVAALPPPSDPAALEAARALAAGAQDLASSLGPAHQKGGGAVAKIKKAAAGGRGGSAPPPGPFGDWRGRFGLPAGA